MPKFSLAILPSISTHPGVYQMHDAKGKIIYVGKARNLKKRVASYFRSQLDTKTQAMITQVAEIHFTITRSDTEALLLEANLIKKSKPRYNVVLRDDKAYPYLHITTEQTYPRLYFYRGLRKKTGESFGPYPNIGSVRENLALLQKLFHIRSCSDTFFKHRSRPCLQYQIKRCTAPCVNYVDEATYKAQVEDARLFLQGKDKEVLQSLSKAMSAASEKQHYEQAAVCRDQITQLNKLQSQQAMSRADGDVDVIVAKQTGLFCVVSVLMVRQGRVLGNKVFYPKIAEAQNNSSILAAFISQFYFDKPASELPAALALNEMLDDKEFLKVALKGQSIKLVIFDRLHEPYKSWFSLAKANTEHALESVLVSDATVKKQYAELQKALNLPDSITRMECFDISHTSGETTVASCVVFDEKGPVKKQYRIYNIHNVTAGDDYAAMEHALRRRYVKLKQESRTLPDIVVIDGGKGQIQQAVNVLQELQCTEMIILGLAKGPERKAGREKIFCATVEETLQIELPHEAKLLLQHIRDEAHRFAITKHRQQRAKKRAISPLENISGVGAARRKALLQYFGGWQLLKDASVEEIAKVSGISSALALVIYAELHK